MGIFRSLEKIQLKTAISAVISIGVIVFVVIQLDLQAVQRTIEGLHWRWVLLAFLVFIVNYTLRTLRFQILLSTPPSSFRNVFAVTGLYGMFNYLLPAKSGEISYPLLLRHHLNLSLTEGATTLFASRYFDFGVIALVLPIILFLFWHSLPAWMLVGSVVYCMLVYVAGAFLLWLLRREGSLIDIKLVAGSFLGHQILMEQGRELLHGLRLIDQRGQHGSIFLLTVGIWLCVYTNYYLLISSMGYSVSYFQVVVISLFMVPMTLLPLQGFANLGTHEVGWVAAFALFGQPQEIALALAVGSHILLLIFVILLGSLGAFVLTMKSIRAKQEFTTVQHNSEH